MKTKILIIILMLTAINSFASNPTGTCTVLKQPCNFDGVIVTTITSGMTLPLTFRYGDINYTIHSNVNSFSDTLYGVSYCYGVYIIDNFGNSLNLSTGIIKPFNVDFPVTTDAICPKTTGTASVTINNGSAPDSVKWFIVKSTYPSFVLGNYVGTGNPINLPSENYIALAYKNGCSEFSQTDSTGIGGSINNVSTITYTVNTTTANCTNGTASITNIAGGIAPYTYKWSNGANSSSISNLTMGLYSTTVTDVQGCYKANNFIGINQSISIGINSSITNATCLQNDGSVITFGSGGTPPYTYLYSNGATSQTASGLSAGTYIYATVIDANGCSSGESYSYISGTTPISVNYSATPSSCTAATGSATLSVKGGTSPYTIDWNTYPLQSGLTINNMPSGSYNFKVTDSVGCIQTGIAYIPPQSNIIASVTSLNPVCPYNTGSVNSNVSGSNPPFTFLWNTGSTAQSLSNVPVGTYSCVITDNIGCSVTKNTFISMTSPVSIGITTTPASCLYASDGSALANAYGGTAPYTYKWSNGQTAYIATGLSTGYYFVNVTDVNGCKNLNNYYSMVGYNSANDSCYCTIKGKVYQDMNGNCQYDSGEQGIEHIMIHCSGYGYSFTDANGDYSFLVPTGNYILSELVQYIYPLASCQNNNVNINVTASSGCISTVDFANVINPLHDIHLISTCSNNAVPGNSFTQGVIVQNDGTVNETNIDFSYKHDGQLLYVNTTPNIYTQLDSVNEPNWYSVNSGFPSLSPGASAILLNNYMVPTNIPLATSVYFQDSAAYQLPMSNWLTDYTPWNNVNKYQTNIVGSFDPNFKEVTPKGVGINGNIYRSDSVLDYVIHFQNTGSYYAENVIVVDTLDPDLDWTSIRLGYSNYNYTASLSDNGILKITFKNINLSCQSQSDINSRGLVAYSIKQKHNLALGTKITSSSAIYFDYNSPINTNTTLNTIYSPDGLEEHSLISDISVYPNPTINYLTLDFGNNLRFTNYELRIYDVIGNLILGKNINNNKTNIDVSSLPSGLYILKVKTENSELIRKFVKE